MCADTNNTSGFSGAELETEGQKAGGRVSVPSHCNPVSGGQLSDAHTSYNNRTLRRWAVLKATPCTQG